MEEWVRIIIPVIAAAFLGALATYIFDRAKEKRLKAQADAKERDLHNEKRRAFYQQMQLHLEASYDAFRNQCFARDRLVALLQTNHGLLPELEYEDIFPRYYTALNEEERALFALIRGITETALHRHNKEMIQLIETNREYYKEVPRLHDLHEHLDLWMSKYNSLFVGNEDQCIVYVGPKEKKRFPGGIDAEIAQRITDLEKERV